MMPVMTDFDFQSRNYDKPDIRRMSIYNRARRDEMDAMLFNLSTRQKVRGAHTSTRTGETLINRLRAAIGNSLIAAGNRIQAAH